MYSRRRCSSSLPLAMRTIVSTATPARMAATEGTLRDRCRPASRVAMRSETGRRELSRAMPTSTIGASMTAPTTRAIVATTVPTSPPSLPVAACEAANEMTAKPPPPARMAPMRNTALLGEGDTLCPFITPTMSSRPRRRAGIRAAITALAMAVTVVARTGSTGRSNGPVRPSVSANLAWFVMIHAASTPSVEPSPAAMTPSTRACASTVWRSCGVVAPLLADRARVRRWRAALTAKAGPTSRVVMTRRRAPPMATRVPVRSESNWVMPWASGVSSLSGGGLRRTSADQTTSP